MPQKVLSTIKKCLEVFLCARKLRVSRVRIGFFVELTVGRSK